MRTKSDSSVDEEYDYENLIPTLFTNTVSDGGLEPAPCPLKVIAMN